MPRSACLPVSPVASLFPAGRVKRHLFTSTLRTGAYAAVTVIGADGVERLVERTRSLTGLEVQAALRNGAVEQR